MALIGEIRKRPVLIMVIIGLALISFVLADSLSGSLGGQAGDNKTIMIEGEPADEITLAHLNDLVEMNSIDLQNLGDERLSNSVIAGLARQAGWKQLAEFIMIEQQAELIDLEVTDEEIEQLFYDGDTNLVATYMQPFRFIDPVGENEQIATWLDFGKSRYENDMRKYEVEKMRLRDKYFALLKSGIYVSTVEAERHNKLTNSTKKIKYAFKSFSDQSLPNEQFSVTDEEIEAFYAANKNDDKYRQTAGKKVQVVEIIVEPTEADAKLIFTNLEQTIKKRFETAIDDSLFAAQQKAVNVVRGRPGMDNVDQVDSARFTAMYPAEYYDQVFNSDETQIFGPFEANFGGSKTYKLLKTTKEKPIAFKEIYINKLTRAEPEFNKLVDSLNTILRADQSKFQEMYKLFNEDTANLANNGVTDYMDFNTMESRYSAAVARQAFAGDSGTLGSILKPDGYRLYQVYDFDNSDSSEFVLASAIEKRILPSGQTIDSYRKTQGMDMIQEGDANGFKVMADSFKYTLNEFAYGEGEMTLRRYSDQTRMFEFVKTAVKGDISPAIPTDDKLYIAHIANTFDDGPTDLEDIYDEVKNDAINKKKADHILSQVASAISVEQAAQIFGGSVQNKDLKFNDQSIAPGMTSAAETRAVGAVFGHDQDGSMMKKPLVGSNGVYVVFVVVTNAPVTTDLTASEKTLKTEYSNILGFTNTATENGIRDPQRNQQMKQFQQTSPLYSYLYFRALGKSGLYHALKQYSDIEDNR